MYACETPMNKLNNYLFQHTITMNLVKYLSDKAKY